MAARIIPAPRRTPFPKGQMAAALVSASRDVTMQDQFLIVDTTGGDVTLTLPEVASVPFGRRLTLIDAGGGNNLILQPAAADDIFGGGAGAPWNVTGERLSAVSITADGTTTWETDGIDAPINNMIGSINGISGGIRGFSVPALGAEAAGVRSTTSQVVDGAGNSAASSLVVGVKVFDDAALTTPSVNGTVAVGAKGTAVSGDATNSAKMKHDVNGELDLNVTDGVGGATHWLVITPVVPHVDNQGFVIEACSIQSAAWV